ncbi:MAG: YihY family inner membrane protein [Opitutales bacterium]|nr:YihY family inner membrane protein [Opitutales bacterium]
MDEENKQSKPRRGRLTEIADFLTLGIWSSDIAQMSKLKAVCYGALRIITTIVNGTIKNKVPIQASSLSYTTLLALGPIVAVVMIFSGMVFKEKGDKFISEKIVDAVVFVMPAVTQVSDNPAMYAEGGEFSEEALEQREAEINPKILEFIEKISKRSASLGIVGSLTVVLTCLLLCVNMESAFNTIWGVEKGRNWMMRFTFYWMLITLGVVLGLSGMTFLTGSQLGGVFKNIPVISKYANWGTQLAGMGALTVALALFYKFMPNTKVRMLPAFIGAVVVACLLLGNNKLSFLYIGKVVQQQSFYGYLAVVPVAMFSLYIFWLFILMGSQITYAVQNIDFLSSSKAWDSMGFKARELICLAIYSEIAKAFYKSEKAPTVKKICENLEIPKEIVSACVATLADKDLICSVEDGDGALKPSHSPGALSLVDFFARIGKNAGDDILEADIAKRNITASHALKAFAQFEKSEYAKTTIKDLLQ